MPAAATRRASCPYFPTKLRWCCGSQRAEDFGLGAQGEWTGARWSNATIRRLLIRIGIAPVVPGTPPSLFQQFLILRVERLDKDRFQIRHQGPDGHLFGPRF